MQLSCDFYEKHKIFHKVKKYFTSVQATNKLLFECPVFQKKGLTDFSLKKKFLRIYNTEIIISQVFTKINNIFNIFFNIGSNFWKYDLERGLLRL